MSKRDARVNLLDMLGHAREAVAILGDTSRKDFSRDRVTQLALARLLEIVGEAANRVPQETQCQHPQIPWSQIIGMRNRLIHGYDVIDYDLVWDTVTSDLPPLIATLDEIAESR